MNHLTTISALLGGSLMSFALTAHANTPFAKKDKSFDQYSWVTTHNSYEKINQNLAELPRQLRDGVRGFMLDLYINDTVKPAEVIKVCHKTIACYGAWSNQLKNEFIPFLRDNPSEVVTLFLETYVERKHLQTVFETIPELANYTFNPENFSGSNWPTLGEMAKNNNRLILLTNRAHVSGNYTVNGKTITVLNESDWVVSNHWATLGTTTLSHNWSCPPLNPAMPITTAKVSPGTNKGSWNRLFLMNQFHGGTSTITDSGNKDNNLTYLNRRAETCGKKPNFIGINNYQNGDASPYAKALSEGGIYFWEGNNADRARDAVCVVPRGQTTLKLPTRGCENDEARSLSLSGISKGTRIIVSDHHNGKTSDDHAIIDVKRDIGINERVVVPTFEKDANNDNYQLVYNRNNGLDGKVSRIDVGVTPTDFSDASIAFYEGNKSTQNLDCVIPFTSHYTIKMKNNSYGCSNDEIRSARIIKAKAGARFTLTGHPDGNLSQGRSEVTVLRDITSPVVIPSFDTNYDDGTIKVQRTGSTVDGQISFGFIGGAK